jgi:uncharacterized repeat protein (TIGR03943 family)
LRSRLLARWQGILLSLIGIVATVWLAATDRLGLYIHPRYFWFTVIMAGIAAVLVVAAFAFAPLREAEHEHGSEPEHEPEPEHEHGLEPEPGHRHRAPSPRAGWVRGALAALIVAGAAVALLVLPPTTLTSSTATQRSINSSGTTLGGDAPTLVGGDTSQFSVKDWALLLKQNPDAEYFAEQDVAVTGFVTPSPDDPENVFYVARFVVTCCAVDAQPVGVPVYFPDWEASFAADQWVEASGAFVPNEGSTSAEPLLLTPDDVTLTEQPEQPYVF